MKLGSQDCQKNGMKCIEWWNLNYTIDHRHLFLSIWGIDYQCIIIYYTLIVDTPLIETSACAIDGWNRVVREYIFISYKPTYKHGIEIHTILPLLILCTV